MIASEGMESSAICTMKCSRIKEHGNAIAISTCSSWSHLYVSRLPRVTLPRISSASWRSRISERPLPPSECILFSPLLQDSLNSYKLLACYDRFQQHATKVFASSSYVHLHMLLMFAIITCELPLSITVETLFRSLICTYIAWYRDA